MAHKLVVGLGNPGPQYEQTWHNLGFKSIRHLAEKLKVSLRMRDVVLFANARYAGHDVTLILPQEYMNASGRAVRRWADKLRVEDEDILVIFDDHDIPRGTMRMKARGGDGGHRGLRSILREMGTGNIPRLRVGIRDEDADPDVGGYTDLAERVLDNLSEKELEEFDKCAKGAARAALDWLVLGITVAMNRNNNRNLLKIKNKDKDQEKQKNKINNDSPKEIEPETDGKGDVIVKPDDDSDEGK